MERPVDVSFVGFGRLDEAGHCCLFKYMGNNIAQWNMVMALATLQLIPPVFLFVFAQRYVVAGLADAAVKQ